MEIKININQHILSWLAAMGYSVSGMPREVIEGMFLREARQWDVSPERLERYLARLSATPAFYDAVIFSTGAIKDADFFPPFGILTYDANILRIEPRHPNRRELA